MLLKTKINPLFLLFLNFAYYVHHGYSGGSKKLQKKIYIYECSPGIYATFDGTAAESSLYS